VVLRGTELRYAFAVEAILSMVLNFLGGAGAISAPLLCLGAPVYAALLAGCSSGTFAGSGFFFGAATGNSIGRGSAPGIGASPDERDFEALVTMHEFLQQDGKDRYGTTIGANYYTG
jgi:hypothetical protein